MPVNPKLHLNSDLFRASLLSWYHRYKRDLPWRLSKDIYAIWLSEVMLQQTQVDTVIPYYNKFMNHFPTISDLASADEASVLKLWEGLGYYQRIKNLHHSAQIIINEHDGVIPVDYEQFIRLPGVGPYIASAVLSIAQDQPYAVIDGNVKRVISRLFCFNPKSNGPGEFRQHADALLDVDHAGDYNQAMMELGATICTVHNPLCHQCPVSQMCLSFKTGKVSEFPAKIIRRKNPVIFKTVFIPDNFPQKLWIIRREETRLLSGLWEFPMQEVDKPQKTDMDEFAIKHVYSHFTERVRIRFVKELPAIFSRQKPVPINTGEIHQYAVTGVAKKILQKLQS